MKNEIGKQVYRKLLYFFENKLPVHIVLSTDNSWHNGNILDLNEDKLTMILREFVEGDIPFLLEHINPDLIKPFRVRK